MDLERSRQAKAVLAKLPRLTEEEKEARGKEWSMGLWVKLGEVVVASNQLKPLVFPNQLSPRIFSCLLRGTFRMFKAPNSQRPAWGWCRACAARVPVVLRKGRLIVRSIHSFATRGGI